MFDGAYSCLIGAPRYPQDLLQAAKVDALLDQENDMFTGIACLRCKSISTCLSFLICSL
jgi:hypothetical protein